MSTKTLLNSGTLLLVLLIMLMLLSFGTLSMLSAWSDLKLARTAAEQTKVYYELEAMANRELAEYGVNDMGEFTVSLNGQNLTVSVLPDRRVDMWRWWRDGFEYEIGGTNIWMGE